MSINQRDHICHACRASGRNRFQSLPERILDADARFADYRGQLHAYELAISWLALSAMSRISHAGNMLQ